MQFARRGMGKEVARPFIEFTRDAMELPSPSLGCSLSAVNAVVQALADDDDIADAVDLLGRLVYPSAHGLSESTGNLLGRLLAGYPNNPDKIGYGLLLARLCEIQYVGHDSGTSSHSYRRGT